jgi:acyl-ACP thioesterase
VTPAPYTALAERPNAGRAYSERVRAGIGTAGPTGRVRMDAIAGWLQDAAYFDLVDAGWKRPAPWLVRRLRIQVQRFPVLGEALRLTTWCSALGKAVAERRTSLDGEDGARIETVAQWVAVDPASGRLAPLNEEFHALFAPSAAGRRSRTRLHHPPEPPPDAARRPFAFRTTDLDAAGHVNNAAYWAVLEDELTEQPVDAPLDAEIEHRAMATARGVEVHAADGARWVLADGEVVATYVLSR